MGLELLLPLLLLWTQKTQESELDPEGLDPEGQNVCKSSSPLAELLCCPGWRQKDQECTIPICEGPDACRKDEVCVKPGLCRCKPGFFGAQCSSPCPDQYWGPDCREICSCHPHGKCDPVTGVCRCQADRWGSNCEFQCSCGTHGRCDPKTGLCHCDPGWWSDTCRRRCRCTGTCLCPSGWWGERCNFRCSCHKSPCTPDTGRCKCLPGWWGTDCRQPCSCIYGSRHGTSGQCICKLGFQGTNCDLPCTPGYYGLHCFQRCGHCKQSAPCSKDLGFCESCEPGWNGTLCQVPCSPGTFGETCSQQCPHCRGGEPCQVETGHCEHCDPGRMGPRCEDSCPVGTFGEDCSSICPTCVQGACDPQTGECVCSAGYWGTSCNSSCLPGFYGNNCSLPCQCSDGLCSPVSGACHWGHLSKEVALIAGSLVLLLLLLLGIACYCWATRLDPKDRPSRGGTTLSRMKQRVCGALSSLGSALLCGSLSGYKLPWVTVSHHDPEVPFNHSFIEQPSAGWASEDSFSSDSESGAENEDSAYCVSSPKGTVPVAQAESLEATFPPPEDASTPFPIPRTSSLARAKRPSVSFAEGTKFVSQSCRSSGELSSPIRKPKRLSRGAQAGPESQETEESTSMEQAQVDKAPPAAARLSNSANGHRFPLDNQRVAEHGETTKDNVQKSSDSVATIYMLAGMPERSEGPVWSVFRRLGNFQKGQAEAKVKSAIPKPPRRALAQKGSTTPSPGSANQSPGLAPSLVGAAESRGVRQEEVSRVLGDGSENPGGTWEPVSRNSLPEHAPQKQAEEEGAEEPLYENVRVPG
ncbi:Endothelial cells scavenger receptor [Heterocephalus glaber]|uniref:Endothelial cells scavenger receptor n=1 Tax=Heterocephalus glaber TaxID=10181 RepID=G5BCV5_HETGA|nr:Endothelial cells scavenger receptor [Heterocephalus glaber]